MGPSPTIKVVIAAGDDASGRKLLDQISGAEGVSITGQVGIDRNAIAEIARLSPNIVIVHTDGSEKVVTEFTSALQKMGTRIKILVVSTSTPSQKEIFDAIDNRVMGYLTNSELELSLRDALNNIQQGTPFYSPYARDSIKPKNRDRSLPHHDLTPRERDVLLAIMAGKDNRKIAHDFNLTEGTIKGYISLIFSKLHLADRTQAVFYAIKHGLG